MLSKDELKNLKSQIIGPIVKRFCNKIDPNSLTKTGLYLGIVAGIFFMFGNIKCAALFMILSGIFDNLDGELARKCKGTTKLGKFLDSTYDRIVDFSLIFGITIYLAILNIPLYPFKFILSDNLIWSLGIFAIFSSLLVSYIRALGEKEGISATLGIADRGGRFFLIFIFALMEIFVAEGLIIYGILFVAILSLHTVWQRYEFISKKLKQNSG